MTIKTGIAALLVSACAIAPAMAQTTAPAPAGSKDTIAEKQGAPMQGRSDSLSSKLSKSDGVIKPQGDVDPAMKVPTPDTSAHPMPVIPPSATGGNSAK